MNAALKRAFDSSAKLYALEPQLVLDYLRTHELNRYRSAQNQPFTWALFALRHVQPMIAIPALVQTIEQHPIPMLVDALAQQLGRIAPQQALDTLTALQPKSYKVVAEQIALIAQQRSAQALPAMLQCFTSQVADTNHLNHRNALLRYTLLNALLHYLEYETAWAQLGDLIGNSWLSLADEDLSLRERQRLNALMHNEVVQSDEDTQYRYLRQLTYPDFQAQSEQIQALLLEKLASDSRKLRYAVLAFVRKQFKRLSPEFIDQVFVIVRHDPQILAELVSYLQFSEEFDPRLAKQLALRIVDEPLYTTYYAQLVLFSSHGDFIIESFDALIAQDALHSDALQALIRLVLRQETLKNKVFSILEQHWREHADARLRRLSLALWQKRVFTEVWDAEAQAQYQTYRADPHPLVAGAALFLRRPTPDSDELDEVREQFDDYDMRSKQP